MSCVYPVWANKYGIAQETTAGTQNLAGYGLLLTEKETYIDPGLQENATKKATGNQYQKTGAGQDFVKTNKMPTTTLPYHGSAANMALPIASLLQNISSSGVGPYVLTCRTIDPLTSADVCISKGDTSDFVAFTTYKDNAGLTTQGDVLKGCVVRSLTLSSSNGDPVEVSAEVIGMEHDSAVDVSSASYTDYAKAPIIHSDFGANVTLDGSAIDLVSWSVTINNNATQRNFTNQEPDKILFGELDVTVELVIPYGATDYKAAALANTDYLFEIWKGSKTGASAGDFYLKSNFNLSPNPQITDVDGMKAWTLSGVGANDGTNEAIKFVLATESELVTVI